MRFLCLLPWAAGKLNHKNYKHQHRRDVDAPVSIPQVFILTPDPDIDTVACSAAFFSHSDADRSIYDTLLGFM